ncbi:MAG: hypothetical protein M1833_000955 [Piccolia ochrophora]|nr:MAG: hypothetical protein M1833_000955 [Piccolia ochrophora]
MVKIKTLMVIQVVLRLAQCFFCGFILGSSIPGFSGGRGALMFALISAAALVYVLTAAALTKRLLFNRSFAITCAVLDVLMLLGIVVVATFTSSWVLVGCRLHRHSAIKEADACTLKKGSFYCALLAMVCLIGTMPLGLYMMITGRRQEITIHNSQCAQELDTVSTGVAPVNYGASRADPSFEEVPAYDDGVAHPAYEKVGSNA